MPKKLILATANKSKIREIKHILESLGLDIVTLDDYPGLEMPPEDAATFAGNALVKARFAASRTGLTALADDSGLEVEILGGRPGVRSARYNGDGASDRDNYLKLLTELKGVPPEKRGARFRCAVALVTPEGAEEVFEGSFEGVITEEPRGANGFGYDPVFYVPAEGRTAAELTPDEKNSMSHRAKALQKLRIRLEAERKKS